MFFCKKSRFLTFIAEKHLTRGAWRWSWTILKVEFSTFLYSEKRGGLLDNLLFQVKTIRELLLKP
jgi:hypothetical protein